MRRTPTFLGLTSLALVLASCGGPSTPTPRATGPLMSLDIAAAGGLRSQGLAGDTGPLFFNVHVRDSQNRPVAFNGTTFDATGTGSTTLTLDSSNAFHQTLLLPADTYSFETVAKDADTSTTLIAYGPAAENTATLQGEGAVVRLKVHAVFDKASSTLDVATNTPQLFTDSSVGLQLSPRIAPVNGVRAAVPTTDIGPVTYTLGNATDGVLGSAGSKLGVRVTARGTAADSVLNVTASFNAWTQVPGTDTAVYGLATLDFSKAIETNGLMIDTVLPSLTLDDVTGLAVGSPSTLRGQATDDVQVSEIRVYDDDELVASNVPDETPTTISTAANGDWSTSWVPSTEGSHRLSVLVSDSSGNETRHVQAVSVAPAPIADYDYLLEVPDGGVPASLIVTLPANSELWFKVNTAGWTGNIYSSVYDYGAGTLTATLGTSRADQRAFGVVRETYYLVDESLMVPNGTAYIHVTNSTASPTDIGVMSFRSY